jgi:serine/threonine protein kinase
LHLQVAKISDFGLAAVLLVETVTYLQPPSLSDSCVPPPCVHLQVAKISDFGLAAVLLDGATHRSTASMGTITHMAPEVLRSGHISPAADV